MKEMVFACPSCCDWFAQTVEGTVDIHSGATYTCRRCLKPVVFVAMTVDEYLKWANAGDV